MKTATSMQTSFPAGIRITDCSIYNRPCAFLDKDRLPFLIMPLLADRFDSFISYYMADMPRNSFNGLPPENDSVCHAWLENIITTGIILALLAGIALKLRIFGPGG